MLQVLAKYWQALVVASTVGAVATALVVTPMAALGLSTSLNATRSGEGGSMPVYYLGETVEIEATVDLGATEGVNTVRLIISGPEPLDVSLPITEGTDIEIPIPAGTLFANVDLEGVEPGSETSTGTGYGYITHNTGGGNITYTLRYTPPIFLTGSTTDTIIGSYSAIVRAVSPFMTADSAPLDYMVVKVNTVIVTIDHPADGAVVGGMDLNGDGEIEVIGTVNDPTVTTVTVNGESWGVADGVWSALVGLVEGPNTVTATATRTAYDPQTSAPATSTIILDLTAPDVSIDEIESPTTEAQHDVTVRWDEPHPATLVVAVSGQVDPVLVKNTFASGQTSVVVPVVLAQGNNVITATMIDKGGNEGSASRSVLVDAATPGIISLGAVYPVGEFSARSGDLVIFPFQVTAPSSGLESVKGNGVDLLERHEIPEALLKAWGVSGNANYLLPLNIPANTPNGSFSVHVVATAESGATSEAVGTAQVSSSRQAFNIYLMPGDNLISLPLLNPDNPNDKFDLSVLLDQAVFNADPDFASGLGRPVTLADIVESFYGFTGGASGVWTGYLPGPAFDDLTEAGPGAGYWVRARTEAFEEFGPLPGLTEGTPSPVKLTVNGRFLRPGQAVPPTYPQPAGWNLVGLHNVQPKPVSLFLAGQTYASLLRYENALTYRGVGAEPPAQLVRGEFENIMPPDSVRPGEGMWLYMVQAGVLVP